MLAAGLLAACGSAAALELLGSSRVEASALNTAATRVSVIGDSLTIGTMPYQPGALSGAGWARSTIDAHGSRGIRTKVRSDKHTGLTAVDAIRSTAGDSVLWVVALGTNDAGLYSKAKQPDMIRLMMDRIGPGHRVLWVNIYLPAKPVRHESWNGALQTVAAERPSRDVHLRLGHLGCCEPTLAGQRPDPLLREGLRRALGGDRHGNARHGPGGRGDGTTFSDRTAHLRLRRRTV